jgi:hypothetical protein
MIIVQKESIHVHVKHNDIMQIVGTICLAAKEGNKAHYGMRFCGNSEGS